MFEQFAIRCCKYLVNQAIENCRRLLLFDEGACIEIYPTPLKSKQSAIVPPMLGLLSASATT